MIDAVAGVTMGIAADNVQLRTAAASGMGETQGVSFTDALKNMAMDQVQSVQNSEKMAMAAMHGKAPLQEVVQATVKAEMAVETAIAVRNKMIEGYQEIMRMAI